MKASELREKTLEELKKLEHDFRNELVRLKFRHASGQLEKTSQLGRIRKNIASLLTVVREKRLKEKRV